MGQAGRQSSKKNSTSYIYAIVSVTFVLFILGLFCILFVNAQRLSSSFKQSVEVSFIVNEKSTETDIKNYLKTLSKKEYADRLEYISKDQAAEEFQKEYGENFMDLLDENPLFSTINLYPKAEYVNAENIGIIEKEAKESGIVEEVFYQKSIVELLDRNLRKLGFVLLILTAGLLFITIALIDSTIKLAMYSNRFLIKSMQLVGATQSYISKPFIKKSVLNGIVSGILASLLLTIAIRFVDQNLPELPLLSNVNQYIVICLSIILVGILISFWSTKSAVTKYLKLRLDELY